jgi:hypothetical protein
MISTAICVALALGGKPMELKPPTEPPVLYGPAIAEPLALGLWLRSERGEDGKPATVRLPVTLEVTGPNFVGNATVGTLQVKVTDAKLGVSLADRFRQAFKDAKKGTLWLAGVWEGEAQFSVSRVLGPAKEGEAAFAQLEAPFVKPELAAAVAKLANPAERDEAAKTLSSAGADAIPALIWSLSDGRTYDVRDIANRMNLPNNARVDPVMANMTVGQRCDDLLQQLITPAVGSPPAGNFKVFSTQVLRVDDWRTFWMKRKGKSLAQIHAELKPLAAKYWEQHGTTQKVP